MMFRGTMTALGALVLLTTAAHAEPILGNWKTEPGETAAISKCGSEYCITLRTGKHAGKQIGKMKPAGEGYSGSITDPADDKTYSGSATVTGSKMQMRGCVLAVLCRSQTWTKL